MTYTATIPGDPRGKGSVRVGRHGAYKDAATESYMRGCILSLRAARTGPMIASPCAIDIVAYLRRPARLVPNPRARTPQAPAWAFPAPTKPDADNVAKAILDALTQAGVISDDCRCVDLRVRKMYVGVGQAPCVVVTVSTLPPPQDQP